MYKYTLILTLAAALAGCGDDTASTPDMAMASPDLSMLQPRRLVILHTNDEHSHLFAGAPELDDFPIATTAGTGPLTGGVARRATVLAAERQAATALGAASITVSAGDNVMGTLPEVGFTGSAPDFTIMKSLGYDASCLGNHEFDFGPAALAAALKVAHDKGALVPTVSTNIHFDAKNPADDTLAAAYSDTPDSTKLVEKYHVLTTSNGLKIGLIGIVGANAAYVETPKAPVTFSLGSSKSETNTAEVLQALYADIQPTVDLLRNQEKVDLVVALSHSGVDLTTPQNGEDYQIAQNVSGIDVIISGHTHTVVPAPIAVKNSATGKTVYVVQAGAYGAYVGKLDVTVQPDGSVTLNADDSKLVPVDETVIPDGPTAAATVAAVHGLENDDYNGSGKSFLEGTLSRIEGTTVTRTSKDGDLYFYGIGKTGFDVIGRRSSTETNILNLSTDAMLYAADKYWKDPNDPNPEGTDLAVQAGGVVRGDLLKGKTGVLSFADVFNVFPLGYSIRPMNAPMNWTGAVGYPLSHFYISLYEIKAALEISVGIGLNPQSDSLFFSVGGMRVSYDTSRPQFDPSAGATDAQNGRVTKIEWMSTRPNGTADGPYDTVLFDVNASSPWAPMNNGRNGYTIYAVVTDAYVASFASSVGVTLRHANFSAYNDLADTVVTRPDGSEVKDYEAFAEYINSISQANNGTLPDRYDEKSTNGMIPRRMMCSGPLCK